MNITDKNIKKDIVRKEILVNYVDLCTKNGHDINNLMNNVLGVTLNKFNYQVLIHKMIKMNDDNKYTYISKDNMEWFQSMITLRKL